MKDQDKTLPCSSYEVHLTRSAERQFRSIQSKHDMKCVDDILLLLDTFPDLGHVYDPIYEVARPPFEIFALYAGHFEIYYTVDRKNLHADVRFIEYQHRDPMKRFGDSEDNQRQ